MKTGFTSSWVISYALLTISCSTISGGIPRTLPAPVAVRPGEAPCEGIQDALECARVVERIQSARAGEAVLRDSVGTCIVDSGGQPICVPHTRTGTSEGGYYVGSLREPPLHLYHVQSGEGTAILAVGARTGGQTLIDALPRPSPDARYVAVASLDLDAGHNPNRFRIHEVRPDSLPVVFELEPDGWGPGTPVWVSLDMVRFPMVTSAQSQVRQVLISDSMTVVHREGRWITIPPSTVVALR